MEDLLKAIEKSNVEQVKASLKLIGREKINEDLKDDKGNPLKIPLVEAASKNNQEILKMLIDSGANVNKPDNSEHCKTALYEAASNGILKNVQLLCENGAAVNHKIKYHGYTALHGAAGKGHDAVVKYLIVEKKADVNIIGEQGTALYRAVIYLRNECVKHLLEKGATVDLVAKKHVTPLVQGIQEKSIDLVKLLIKYKANVNGIPNAETPLFMAVKKEFIEAVQFLIESKADVNKIGLTGTPISEAAKTKNVAILKLLLEKGADPKLKDKKKKSAIDYATEVNAGDEIIALLNGSKETTADKGADDTPSKNMQKLLEAIKAKNIKEVTDLLKKSKDLLNKDVKDENDNMLRPPLVHAASIDCPEMVELLLKHGADVNKGEANDVGNTALFMAAAGGKLKNAEILCKNGADVNLQIKYLRYTPIHGAAGKGHLEVLKHLLAQKADINIMGEQGTALYRATLYKQKKIVKYLLDNGADVDLAVWAYSTCLIKSFVHSKDIELMRLLLDNKAKVDGNDNEESPLFRAAKTNNIEAAKVLLERKANINLVRMSGPPLFEAIRNKNVAMVRLLLDNGADPKVVNKNKETALDMAKNKKVGNEIIDLLNGEGGKKAVIETKSNSASTPEKATEKKGYDVMLSYQWDYQNQVLKVKEYLEENGNLKVWMDVEEMRGGINGRMAEAVISSEIIILCMSEKYEKSRNCQKEFKYADKCAKDIIPVKMESKFEPTRGTALDIIISDGLYYDLEKDFDTEVNNLLKAVLSQLQE